MKVIVAGGRDITDKDLVFRLINKTIQRWNTEGIEPITEIVSGTARGVDTLGEVFAEENNIPIKRFPADWENNGKAAGPIRNRQMADYADRAIIIMHEDSRGSKNMFETMKKLNKHGCVYIVNKEA